MPCYIAFSETLTVALIRPDFNTLIIDYQWQSTNKTMNTKVHSVKPMFALAFFFGNFCISQRHKHKHSTFRQSLSSLGTSIMHLWPLLCPLSHSRSLATPVTIKSTTYFISTPRRQIPHHPSLPWQDQTTTSACGWPDEALKDCIDATVQEENCDSHSEDTDSLICCIMNYITFVWKTLPHLSQLWETYYVVPVPNTVLEWPQQLQAGGTNITPDEDPEEAGPFPSEPIQGPTSAWPPTCHRGITLSSFLI